MDDNKPENILNIDWNYEVGVHFINDYVEYCNDLNSTIGRLEWIDTRQDLTSAFKNEFKRIINEAEKKNPDFGLGFDPIIAAQDNPNQFEVESKDSEYLIVKGINWPEFRLTMKLKFIENRCYVDGSGIINIPKNKQIER